jgi:hypothetical protein
MKRQLEVGIVDKPVAEQTYWFGPKATGIGMTPASWQGWVLTLGFLAFVFGALLVSRYIPNRPVAAVFDAIAVIVALVVYLWVAQRHMKPGTEF